MTGAAISAPAVTGAVVKSLAAAVEDRAGRTVRYWGVLSLAGLLAVFGLGAAIAAVYMLMLEYTRLSPGQSLSIISAGLFLIAGGVLLLARYQFKKQR